MNTAYRQRLRSPNPPFRDQQLLRALSYTVARDDRFPRPKEKPCRSCGKNWPHPITACRP